MDGSLQYSALTRLLTLNNQVHDLENQMLTEKVPAIPVGIELLDQTIKINSYQINRLIIFQVFRSKTRMTR